MTSLILGSDLAGPRVYFTNLDHTFGPDQFAQGVPALKLQALLKQNIVVAASSLFDDKWYSLVKEDVGLQKLINLGVILPAMRDEFSSIGEFFDRRPSYGADAKEYYSGAVGKTLTWSLRDTTSWFAEKFIATIETPKSLSRMGMELSASDVDRLKASIDEGKLSSGMLTREAVAHLLDDWPVKQKSGMLSYVDLLYGISGAKAVNAEGHFPQFLFNFQFPNQAVRLDEQSIFWDCFVAGIMDGLNAVCRIDPERLGTMSFSDIHSIRSGLVFDRFSAKFDRLAELAKSSVEIGDEDRLILSCQEVMETAETLRRAFFEEINIELKAKSSIQKAEGIYEATNTLVSIGSMFIAGPIAGIASGAFSLLSTFNSSPVAARLFGPAAQMKIERCVAVVKDRLGRMTGISRGERTAMIDMYRSLALHGLE
jgi:hypothetical protein